MLGSLLHLALLSATDISAVVNGLVCIEIPNLHPCFQMPNFPFDIRLCVIVLEMSSFSYIFIEWVLPGFKNKSQLFETILSFLGLWILPLILVHIFQKEDSSSSQHSFCVHQYFAYLRECC